MNERIRELAEQAGFYYTDKTGFISPAGSDPAKFAELIVRHCTYQCYLIGESGLAHELSDDFGFKFDFRKMMEDEDE